MLSHSKYIKVFHRAVCVQRHNKTERSIDAVPYALTPFKCIYSFIYLNVCLISNSKFYTKLKHFFTAK